jgi:hypothetical protein
MAATVMSTFVRRPMPASRIVGKGGGIEVLMCVLRPNANDLAQKP